MMPHKLTSIIPTHFLLKIALSLMLTTPTCLALAQEAPLLPNGSFEILTGELPADWNVNVWGIQGTASATIGNTFVHSGNSALSLKTHSASSYPGVFLQRSLNAGTYRISVFARAPENSRAAIRFYIGNQYSPPFIIKDSWTEISWTHEITRRMLRSEINLQLTGPDIAEVWVDDIALQAVTAVTSDIKADPRPLDQQPQLLCSAGNFSYQRDTAVDWSKRGFAGFMFPYILSDWTVSPWEEDGDAQTVDSDDALLQEAQRSIRSLREVGISQNALKVTFATPMPRLDDDIAWGQLTQNLCEGASFARQSGLSLMVLDLKLMNSQLTSDVKAWGNAGVSIEQTGSQLARRWATVGMELSRVWPRLELGLTPEGPGLQGYFWDRLFNGFVSGLRAADHQGRLQVFCQGTFWLRNPFEIRDHAQLVRSELSLAVSGEDLAWWEKRGSIALGAWPLGYYRKIIAEGDKFLGWGGRREAFGNQLIGPFADKGPRYSTSDFRQQMAALRQYSDQYVWINSLGSAWWQAPVEKADYYEKQVHRFPRDNYLAPVSSDINDYYKITSQREVIEVSVR